MSSGILRKRNGGRFMLKQSPYDTTNLICRFGHIYQDGRKLVASLDLPPADRGPRTRLRNLGQVVMDGDDGLTVKFPPAKFEHVCEILKPVLAPPDEPIEQGV